MKVNAFTAKPDLSAFIKKANHSRNSAMLGKKISESPTPEQRAKFFSVITPVNDAHKSRPEGSKGQPVGTDATPVHDDASSVRARQRKKSGV